MSSHDLHEEEPSYPVEKHTLNNHTELKINPAAKHKVNYEDVSNPRETPFATRSASQAPRMTNPLRSRITSRITSRTRLLSPLA
jgi:hypothetical protein